MSKFPLVIFFFVFFCIQSHGQDSLPLFRAPLEIPLYLSGNFAEMRRNHFHTGIDIKTAGVEGQKVLAAAPGTVSRINVSPYGYGNAIYIDHPNGYTTVYGHLQSFAPKIAQALKKKQYELQAFNVDFTPDEIIEVTAGELIALSGNSGGSGGPHLHFEIRNTSNERPQNPLKFGFDIKDDIPPRIRGLRYHPKSDTTLINGKNEAQSFVVTGDNGKYKLKDATAVTVYGAFGLSLHTIDFLNAYPNKCGIYALRLEVDDALITAQDFEELDFATVRNINSYKDYEAYKNHNWHYHKSFVEKGNRLEIYDPKPENGGILNYTEESMHRGKYTSIDAYGNESELLFTFKSIARPNAAIPPVKTYDAYFDAALPNSYTYGNEFEISIPQGALYEDLKFQFGREVANSQSVSPYYLVQNEDVPLQMPIELKFDWGSIPVSSRAKVLIKRSDLNGRSSYYTGRATDAHIIGSSKEFGIFSLVMDTIAPTISTVSSPNSVSANTTLKFRIKDERSGIDKYNGYLNGKWVLMAFDAKNAALTLDVGESDFIKGKNELRIKIEDAVGNSTEKSYSYNF